MLKKLFAIFLLVASLSSHSGVNGQSNIPNANDHCRLLFGDAASFCQSSLSTICSALSCRLNFNSTVCVTASYGALDGTPCGLGRICSSRNCVGGQSAFPIDCLLGDGLLVNQTQILDPLPLPQMSCSAFMNYLLVNNRSPFVYCAN